MSNQYFFNETDEFLIQLKNWMQNNPNEKPTEVWYKVVAWNKGKKLTESHKQAIADAHKKAKVYYGNARPGIVFTEEHKKKLSEAAKKRKLPMSDSHKETLRKRALEREQKPLCDTCPHCGWHGLKRVAYRYHFSKCKNNPILPK